MTKKTNQYWTADLRQWTLMFLPFRLTQWKKKDQIQWTAALVMSGSASDYTKVVHCSLHQSKVAGPPDNPGSCTYWPLHVCITWLAVGNNIRKTEALPKMLRHLCLQTTLVSGKFTIMLCWHSTTMVTLQQRLLTGDDINWFGTIV